LGNYIFKRPLLSKAIYTDAPSPDGREQEGGGILSEDCHAFGAQ